MTGFALALGAEPDRARAKNKKSRLRRRTPMTGFAMALGSEPGRARTKYGVAIQQTKSGR